MGSSMPTNHGMPHIFVLWVLNPWSEFSILKKEWWIEHTSTTRFFHTNDTYSLVLTLPKLSILSPSKWWTPCLIISPISPHLRTPWLLHHLFGRTVENCRSTGSPCRLIWSNFLYSGRTLWVKEAFSCLWNFHLPSKKDAHLSQTLGRKEGVHR